MLPSKPTEAEMEILQLLWKQGPMTVRELHDMISERKNVGYTTTLKIIQIMFQKGLLTRNKDGKGHRYTAAIPQTETRQVMVDKLVDSVFEGSAVKLVMQALGGTHTTSSEIAQIREYLDKLEGENHEH